MKDQAIVCNIGHFDKRDPGGSPETGPPPGVVKNQYQAAGRYVHVPRRPLYLPAGGRPPGQPGLRQPVHPQLRDVQNSFLQPGRFAPTRTSGRNRDIYEVRRLHPAQESSTKRWPDCTWRRSAPKLTHADPQSRPELHRRPDRRPPTRRDTYRY